MQILANTPNGLKNKKASEKGSHIIKSKLLIHFNSFKKDLRLWVGCLAGRGGGRETPHQTSDWFKRGPAKPHSLKGKDGLGFRETPETSPRKRWLWLEVAAELRGPGAPPLSGRLPPGERGGWLEAGRALQLGSAKSPPLPLPGAPSHCPPFSGTPSGCWRLEPAPPGSPPLAWGHLGDGASSSPAYDWVPDQAMPPSSRPWPGVATRAGCRQRSVKLHVSRPLLPLTRQH